MTTTEQIQAIAARMGDEQLVQMYRASVGSSRVFGAVGAEIRKRTDADDEQWRELVQELLAPTSTAAMAPIVAGAVEE